MSGAVRSNLGNRVAVFIDFENIKLSVDASFEDERVDLKNILEQIVAEADARILVKRAYADWGMFRDYRSDLLDNATEPVQAFALTYKGKNGADIRIAIDVMEFVLRHPDLTHVALVSGDSDFTPLVMKLREFGLTVIGVGVRNNTSAYLAKSCDRFLYYDDFRVGAPAPATLSSPTPQAPTPRPASVAVTSAPAVALSPGYTPYVPSGGIPYQLPAPPPAPPAAPTTRADEYRFWLRDNNFRHVPASERQEVIRVVFETFEESNGKISLKEAKDRVHEWFEANQPAVSWDSINSAVYHLFYTFCFRFDKSDEGDGKQLWDRRTSLQDDIESVEALEERADRGVVRKLWEKDRESLDPVAVNDWLYDGNKDTLARVKELIVFVSSPSYAPVTRF